MSARPRRRVLFVSNTYLPDSVGGVEIHLRGLARAIRPRCDAFLFRRGADPALPALALTHERIEDLEVTRLNYLFHDATTFASLVSNPAIRARFDEVLREVAPDLVHVHHVTCLTADILSSLRAARIPTVFSLHDYWMGCPRGQRLTAAMTSCETIERSRCARCYADTWPHFFPRTHDGEPVPDPEWRAAAEAEFDRYHERIRAAIDCAQVLVVPSEFTREQFVRYGIARERLRVVPYGIDPPAAIVERRAPHRPFRFGFIGTVFPSKGVHVLIDAFARLGTGGEATLDIYGEEPPYHNDPTFGARMHRQARAQGDRVRFHGRYRNEDVYEILAALDALVVPSIWFETYGIVMREAFLAQVPVIATDMGAMAEGIEHERTGLRFARGDAAALAQQMRRLMGDPELWLRLARAPKPILSVQENAEALLRLYDEAHFAVTGKPLLPAND